MRISFLAIIFQLLQIAAHGQSIFSKEDSRIFYGGLSLGTNFSQVDGDGYSGYHKVGIAAGGIVYVRPFQQFGASLGIGYAQKGSAQASIQGSAIGPAVSSYRMHLQYVEVPLLFHFFSTGRFHYSAGISYARLLSSKEEVTDVNGTQIDQNLYPFQKQDWDWILGIAYRLYGQVFVSGQYQYSLGSIRSDPFIPPGYGGGMQHNNVVALRLIFLIGSGTTGER